MYFVGREKEIKKVIRSVEGGNNVIVTGKYGIGRTSLIRHVEDLTQDRWRFAFTDFSLMPGKISQQLLSQLSRRKKRSQQNFISAKSGRHLLTQLEPDRKKRIIVLDNIAKLTYQKLALIRYIGWEKKFHFIALIDPFLPEHDLLRLRAELLPSIMLNLSYLDRRSTGEYFRYYSGKHHLEWTENDIDLLISTTRGYPLGMKEFVEMKFRRARSREEILIEE